MVIHLYIKYIQKEFDFHHLTIFFQAAQKDSDRHVDVVKILIEANAPTDIKNSEGLAPYELARNGEIKSLCEPVVEGKSFYNLIIIYI